MNVWYFTDNKPGHENQVLGLLDALSNILEINSSRLEVNQYKHSFWHWLSGNFPNTSDLAQPDLIIGAGHSTHWAVKAASRATGAKSLILMTPSLPLGFFDFIVAPAHDKIKPAPNHFISVGALNRMKADVKEPNTGLILIGGHSNHVQWDSDLLIEQIELLLQRTPDLEWKLTTSRRTPTDFVDKLQQTVAFSRIRFIPWENCPKDWLKKELPTTENCWITPDSVSMVYEALTADCWVGLFNMQMNDTRVVKGLKNLILSKKVNEFSESRHSFSGKSKSNHFNEATRCAYWLIKQFENINPGSEEGLDQ